ncbi:MAG: sugar phosphate isomerase/epimerase [Sedimentisphaerales bacterium]|nr:sugar phosphate isomerase/epimerase [Sedimentisphaerales bacterium]
MSEKIAEYKSRREFLSRSAALGTALALASALKTRAAGAKEQKLTLSTPNAEKIGWNLACQLYTFRDRSFYEAMDVIAKIGIRHVEPCFFLPLSKEQPDLKTSELLSLQDRRTFKKKMADRGIRMTNYYAPIDGNKADFEKIFDFAKEMGVKNIIAEPPAEVFDELEELCNKYKINLAIHNHPKSPDSKYASPDSVFEVIKGRGKRIGACADTGHWVRSGLDPVECLKKLKDRIICLHLKDVAEIGKPQARDVPLGTGKADYNAVLNELYAQKYRGIMSVEYEHLSPQLVEDVAQCVKFVEDFAASIKA